jgi:hypothetical protein
MEQEEWSPQNGWEEHPRFPRADWKYEVENGDTSLGYVEWVNNQIQWDEGEE